MPRSRALKPVVPLRAEELPAALRVLLAAPTSLHGADDSQVRGFLNYLATSRVQWEGYRCGPATSPHALFLGLLMPGRTAIAMVPTPGKHGIDPAAQHHTTQTALKYLRGRGLHFVQALLSPEACAQRQLIERLGFRLLAPFIYLERDTHYPWVDPPGLPPTAWARFGPEKYPEFAATLLATYEDSLDCPELASLRPIDDVIAGHQGSGQHDPGLWELLRVEGRNAGCLLLSRLPAARAVEIVYMGVVPDFRQQGLGALLLRRAFERGRECGVRRIMLAVDERNHPARRLYARFSFRVVDRRDGYLYCWPPAGAEQHRPAAP